MKKFLPAMKRLPPAWRRLRPVSFAEPDANELRRIGRCILAIIAASLALCLPFTAGEIWGKGVGQDSVSGVIGVSAVVVEPVGVVMLAGNDGRAAVRLPQGSSVIIVQSGGGVLGYSGRGGSNVLAPINRLPDGATEADTVTIIYTEN